MATSHDRKMDLVHDLVYTRINGNSIMNNATYRGMLKRITKRDIQDYAVAYSFAGYDTLYGTKLEMIEQIAKGR